MFAQFKLEPSTWSLASGLVAHLAATANGATLLLRAGPAGATPAPGGGGEGFLGAAQRVVTQVRCSRD